MDNIRVDKFAQLLELCHCVRRAAENDYVCGPTKFAAVRSALAQAESVARGPAEANELVHAATDAITSVAKCLGTPQSDLDRVAEPAMLEWLQNRVRALYGEVVEVTCHPPKRSDVLGDSAFCLLSAAYVLKACDADSRVNGATLVQKAFGKKAHYDSYKKFCSGLVGQGLFGSVPGRGGGYWLTEAGKSRAENSC